MERPDGRWRLKRKIVVYGGDESRSRSAGELVAWKDLPELVTRNVTTLR